MTERVKYTAACKVATPPKWVDAAIACGAELHCVQGTFDWRGRLKDELRKKEEPKA